MNYTVVLICLGNFQEYIMTCISQLIKLGHTNVHVVTSRHLMDEFEPFAGLVQVACADDLPDIYDYKNKSKLNREFRGGFWYYASSRMFVLHAYMVNAGLNNVIHIENDVLLYHHCNELTFQSNKHIWMPFDSYKRNIASIMYVPNASLLGKVLENYNYEQNDMYNFANNALVRPLPICISQPNMTDEQLWVSTICPLPFIFDAAAMGQMVGGVDPRNIHGDTRGFINEECVIKYNDYGTIVWINYKPYYRVEELDIPIFNLHIHSKNLSLYTS